MQVQYGSLQMVPNQNGPFSNYMLQNGTFKIVFMTLYFSKRNSSLEDILWTVRFELLWWYVQNSAHMYWKAAHVSRRDKSIIMVPINTVNRQVGVHLSTFQDDLFYGTSVMQKNFHAWFFFLPTMCLSTTLTKLHTVPWTFLGTLFAEILLYLRSAARFCF